MEWGVIVSGPGLEYCAQLLMVFRYQRLNVHIVEPPANAAALAVSGLSSSSSTPPYVTYQTWPLSSPVYHSVGAMENGWGPVAWGRIVRSPGWTVSLRLLKDK